MMNQVKEKSPRPDAAGRDDKAVQKQVQYNIFNGESQALVRILGQDHVIEMLFQKKSEGENAGLIKKFDEVHEADKAYLQKFKEIEKVCDFDLLFEMDECSMERAAAVEKQGFYYGARYMLNFIFGGGLFEN